MNKPIITTLLTNRAPRGKGRPFVGLHWKGFLWLSSILIALSGTFYGLSYHNLLRQFHAQRAGEVQTFRQQISALVRGSSDRLIRLGGALISLGVVDNVLNSGAQDRPFASTTEEQYQSLGYELDVQRIGLLNAQNHEVWHWATGDSRELTPLQLRAAINRVRREEMPVTVLSCRPNCLLHALMPVLVHGEEVWLIELAQSIADLVIEFRVLTGTDIGILVPDNGDGGTKLWAWNNVLSALTDSPRLTPFLKHLAEIHPQPGDLANGRLIEWQGNCFDVTAFPLSDFLPSEAGHIFLITDVSRRLTEIRSAARQGLYATMASLAAAELILFYLIRVPLRRLGWFAHTLPLLARGAYTEARERLVQPQGLHRGGDEIDLLYATAATLSHQLEQNDLALAAKNREIARERDFIQGLLDAAQVLVITQTRQGIIDVTNEFATQITGYSAVELRGRRFIDLIAESEAHEEVLARLATLNVSGQRRVEHVHGLSCRDGALRQVMWVHTRFHNATPDQAAIVSVGLDITERVQAESRMRWLANHDELTGLINRHRFIEDLQRTLDQVERTKTTAALLLLDLDHFKEINDTSGHAAGDALLRLIADELRNYARRSDLVARLGGDEFSVLLPDTDAQGAENFARRINSRLGEIPFVFGERRYRLGASIGIAMLPEHGDDVEELLANADLALYEAKRAGRYRAQLFVYEHAQREALNRGVYWKDVLSRSFLETRFFFHFQPVVDAKSGEIEYYEALLRLRLDDGRISFPGEFLIPLQRAGLNYELDCYVVETALELLLAHPEYRLSINLTSAALADDGWTRLLQTARKVHSLDPGRLIFEITETAVIADMQIAKEIMNKVTQYGFCFAVDDFGAGFSSLYYLRQLPVTFIKLDRSLIHDIVHEQEDREFVGAITAMVQAFGKKVIAEGVEDQETVMLLRSLHVDLLQGYFIGKPKEHAAFTMGALEQECSEA